MPADASNSRSQIEHVRRLVLVGRITPEQGASLLALRREIARRRRPWWRRAASMIMRVIFQ